MNSSPTSRPAVSSKTKWRLGLLLVVAAVMLLPTLFLAVRHLAKPPVLQVALPTKMVSAAPAGAPAAALTILRREDNQRSQSRAAAMCQRAKKETAVFS